MAVVAIVNVDAHRHRRDHCVCVCLYVRVFVRTGVSVYVTVLRVCVDESGAKVSSVGELLFLHVNSGSTFVCRGSWFGVDVLWAAVWCLAGWLAGCVCRFFFFCRLAVAGQVGCFALCATEAGKGVCAKKETKGNETQRKEKKRRDERQRHRHSHHDRNHDRVKREICPSGTHFENRKASHEHVPPAPVVLSWLERRGARRTIHVEPANKVGL